MTVYLLTYLLTYLLAAHAGDRISVFFWLFTQFLESKDDLHQIWSNNLENGYINIGLRSGDNRT